MSDEVPYTRVLVLGSDPREMMLGWQHEDENINGSSLCLTHLFLLNQPSATENISRKKNSFLHQSLQKIRFGRNKNRRTAAARKKNFGKITPSSSIAICNGIGSGSVHSNLFRD